MRSLRSAPLPAVPFQLRRRQCETNSVRGSDHGVAVISFVAPGWELDRMRAEIVPEGAKSKDVRNEGNSCQLIEKKRPENRHNVAIKEFCPSCNPLFSAHPGPVPARVANCPSLCARTSLGERRAGGKYLPTGPRALEAVPPQRGPDQTSHPHNQQHVEPPASSLGHHLPWKGIGVSRSGGLLVHLQPHGHPIIFQHRAGLLVERHIGQVERAHRLVPGIY